MTFILLKIILAVSLIIEIVAGTPVDYENHSTNTRSTGFFGSFFAPVKKVQHYVGNLFAPAVTHSNSKGETHFKQTEPFDNGSGNKPVPELLHQSAKSSLPNNYYEQTTSKNIVKPVTIDKEILDKIFNNYNEIDHNSIYTTEDSMENTTGTGDYEATTDNFLRIPPPVVATLLGR